jgi:hypothetical protein
MGGPLPNQRLLRPYCMNSRPCYQISRPCCPISRPCYFVSSVSWGISTGPRTHLGSAVQYGWLAWVARGNLRLSICRAVLYACIVEGHWALLCRAAMHLVVRLEVGRPLSLPACLPSRTPFRGPATYLKSPGPYGLMAQRWESAIRYYIASLFSSFLFSIAYA